MFCPVCGQQFADAGARYCAACGSPLPAAGAASIPAAPAAGPVTPAAAAYAAPGFTGAVDAGFWRRVGAFVLDLLVLGLINFAVGFVWGFVDYWIGLHESAGSRGALFAVQTVIGIVYFVAPESGRHQATWGKRVLGIVVTDVNGRRIGPWRAAGRYFGKYLSGLPLGVGYAMAGYTARRQALHDMLAATLVVDHEALRQGALRNVAPPARRLSGGGVAVLVISVLMLAAIILLAAFTPWLKDQLDRANVARTHEQGMIAARLVGVYYEQNRRVPASLQSLGYQAPRGFRIVVDRDGVISATHVPSTLMIRLIPSEVDGKVVWRCDPGKLPPSKTGDICRQSPNVPITSVGEIVGCWERIDFSEDAKRKMNANEPWPIRYQWFCFEPDGTYSMFGSSSPRQLTSAMLEEMFKQLPKEFSYALLPNSIIKTEAKSGKQTLYWEAAFTSNSYSFDQKVVEKGTLVMALSDRKNRPVYYRYLKRVP